jgi:dTMP kinase
MNQLGLINSLAGKFIVFDGGEGSGKSTQARLLRDELEAAGVPVTLVHDPGTTRVGKLIREILLDPQNVDIAMRCEMLLYMAARSQMMSELIEPALKRGKVVLCDRFVSSTLSYQLGGDGLTADEIRAVGEAAIKGRWPDLTLIFDLPIEASFKRLKPKFVLPFPQQFHPVEVKDRIEQRPTAYHEQVRANYLAQAKRNPERYRVIDADREIEPIRADVRAAVHAVGR